MKDDAYHMYILFETKPGGISSPKRVATNAQRCSLSTGRCTLARMYVGLQEFR
jgi:hypothetical protein